MDTQDDNSKLTLKSFLADGGMKSRKLWLTVFAMMLLSAGVGLACHWAAIVGLYSEYVAGILGCLSIFVGGNVIARNATTKHIGGNLAIGADPEASPEPKPRKPE